MRILDKHEIRLSNAQLDLLGSFSDAEFDAAAEVLVTTPDSFVTWLDELDKPTD